MKHFNRILCLTTSLLFLVSCASNNTLSKAGSSQERHIEFIDLDTFDMLMTRDMQNDDDVVVVKFPNQPVTINNMPERLQKWLSAVHKHGQGVTIAAKEEGYVQKDVLSLVGVLVSGYKLVKDNMPAILGRKYKAVITMGNQKGDIDKVEFIRF